MESNSGMGGYILAGVIAIAVVVMGGYLGKRIKRSWRGALRPFVGIRRAHVTGLGIAAGIAGVIGIFSYTDAPLAGGILMLLGVLLAVVAWVLAGMIPTPVPTPQPPPAESLTGSDAARGCLVIVGGLFVLLVIGAIGLVLLAVIKWAWQVVFS